MRHRTTLTQEHVCPYCETAFQVPAAVYIRFERTCDMPPPARAAAIECSRSTGRPLPPYTMYHYCESGVPKEIPS